MLRLVTPKQSDDKLTFGSTVWPYSIRANAELPAAEDTCARDALATAIQIGTMSNSNEPGSNDFDVSNIGTPVTRAGSSNQYTFLQLAQVEQRHRIRECSTLLL
jgi:hypothetical protein